MKLPDKVNPSESLARYLTHHSHYNSLKNVVKPSAFQPPPDLHLSVFRIDGLAPKEVWKIGQANVINAMSPHGKSIHGFADIKASAVYETNLDVDPDNSPPRHANIIGWPEGPERKSNRKLLALELAARATLRLQSQIS